MRVFYTVFFLLLVSTSQAQSPLQASIDSLFQTCNDKTPGYAVAVVKDGKIECLKGYGMANLEYGTPITPETVFHLASVSKQFTAYSIYQLISAGKLQLDDPVKKYLPDFRDYGHPVTIRNLLNHTSGVRDLVELLGLSGIAEPDAVTEQNTLSIVYRQKELNFAPGEKWLYSNSGYLLLAAIIEKVSGRSFREFEDKNIFAPMGMKNTFINDNAQQIVPQRASSYEKDTVPMKYLKRELNYSFYGPTNMNSTARDLASWVINLDRDRLIFEKMAKRAVLNNGDTVFYGSGFFVDKYRGIRRVYHDGNDAGFETFVGYFPDRRLGIVVLSNLLNSDPTSKAMRIANLYVPRPVRRENAAQRPAEKYNYVKTNQAYLKAYTGNYETPGGNLIKIFPKDTSLQIKFPDLDKPQTLTAINDTLFHVFDDMLISFRRKQAGGFQQIGLKRPAFSNTAERVEYAVYTEQQMREFTGTFYAEEIQTVYEVKIINNTLVMSSIMNSNIQLNAKTKDKFATDRWYAGKIVFQRDKSQKVTSFSVSSDRMKNVLFKKISSL